LSRTDCLAPPMNATQKRPGFLSFILEAAKLCGIAIACLLVIAAAVILSAKTGFAVPARWFGLFYWTCALLWFVFQRHKRDLRYGRFWLALSAFLTVHVTAFAVALRTYPQWRMIWFMFVFMIEGPLVLVVLRSFVHPTQRSETHSANQDGWR
jgi:hypothetical protein